MKFLPIILALACFGCAAIPADPRVTASGSKQYTIPAGETETKLLTDLTGVDGNDDLKSFGAVSRTATLDAFWRLNLGADPKTADPSTAFAVSAGNDGGTGQDTSTHWLWSSPNAGVPIGLRSFTMQNPNGMNPVTVEVSWTVQSN